MNPDKIANPDYRYTLRRHLHDAPGPTVCWVMLNPSKADDLIDDQTITKITTISKAHGYSGLVVINLFAVRSTEPKLLELFDDPVGPGNDDAWRDAICSSADVVFAWGASRFCGVRWQAQRIAWLCVEQLHEPLCLGFTKDGAPKHPCRLANATNLIPFRSALVPS